jgi:hypothetical protein
MRGQNPITIEEEKATRRLGYLHFNLNPNIIFMNLGPMLSREKNDMILNKLQIDMNSSKTKI